MLFGKLKIVFKTFKKSLMIRIYKLKILLEFIINELEEKEEEKTVLGLR